MPLGLHNFCEDLHSLGTVTGISGGNVCACLAAATAGRVALPRHGYNTALRGGGCHVWGGSGAEGGGLAGCRKGIHRVGGGSACASKAQFMHTFAQVSRALVSTRAVIVKRSTSGHSRALARAQARTVLRAVHHADAEQQHE